MLIAAIGLLSQTTVYASILVYETPNLADRERPTVHVNVFTNDEMIAGHTAEVIGNHGETGYAVPFVWENGKLHKLPVGKAKEGQVYAGNAKMLIGDVYEDYKSFPAKWTPDPDFGWSKPTLHRLGTKPGYAVACTESGEIWVQEDDGIARYTTKAVDRYDFGKLDVKGIDSTGTAWANQYDGLGIGNTRIGEKAVLIRNGRIAQTFPQFSVVDVNAKGEACGMVVDPALSGGVGTLYSGAAIFRKGQMLRIPFDKDDNARCSDINEEGSIAGNFLRLKSQDADRKRYRSFPFLYRTGKVEELPMPAKDVDWVSDLRLNDKGAIVLRAYVEGGYRIYLMRRAPKTSSSFEPEWGRKIGIDALNVPSRCRRCLAPVKRMLVPVVPDRVSMGMVKKSNSMATEIVKELEIKWLRTPLSGPG